MRYELKAAAKETFMEQLGEMRRSNQLTQHAENEKQFQLEMEVQKLRLMVDDLKAQQLTDSGTTNPMESHWAAMQSNRFHTPGNLDMQSSDASSINSLTRNPNYMPPLTALSNYNQSPAGYKSNGIFVLSCAPVNNFEDVVQSELSTTGGFNSSEKKGAKRSSSLTQQIHQFNELQSLFALPSYESELQGMYSLRQQQASRQQRGPDMSYAENEEREERLQSGIDKHRERLAVSRELNQSRYSPRIPTSPGPRASSQQFRSPRRPLAETGRSSSHNHHRQNSPFDKSFSAPAAQHAAALTGAVPQLDANSSLKEIIRSSMHEHTATAQEQQEAAAAQASSPIKVQDLTVEEFKSITDK